MPKNRKKPPMRKKHVSDSDESFVCEEISPAEVQKRQRTRRQRQHHQITTTDPLIRRVKTKTRRLDSTLFSVKDSGESEDEKISPATDSPLFRRVKTTTRRLDSTLFSLKDSVASEDEKISPATDSPLFRRVKTTTRRLDSTLFSLKDSVASEDGTESDAGIEDSDDDEMLMSPETRMSITGRPQQLDSDDSTTSDEENRGEEVCISLGSDEFDEDIFTPLPMIRNAANQKYPPPPSYPNQYVLDNKMDAVPVNLSPLSDVVNRGEEVCISLSSDEFDEDIFTPLPMIRNAANQKYPPPPSYPNQYVLDNKMDAVPVNLSPLSDVVRVLTWDELQKGSHAVKPKKFGVHAIRTHTQERTLILERLRDLHAALGTRPSHNQEASAPGTMKTELMPHQKQALAWLRWREEMNPHGGILADDMGLGKTITMIALIAGDRDIPDGGEESEDETLVKGGTLVVCPPSIKDQWEGELTKHCQANTLKTATHHGPAKASDPKLLAHMDVVITTYSTLLRGQNGVLTNILWNRLILDEAHVVRNYKNATSRAVCSLHARCRWVLTGTPLHNKDLDLFALLKFLRCTPFDDLTMWKKWIDEKSPGGQQRLSLIMSSIMLRRTKLQLKAKGQLQDLPPRIAHECFVTLTKEEMSVYQKLLVFSKGLFAQYLELREEVHDDEDSMLHQTSQNDSYMDLVNMMIALEGAKPVVKTHEILVLLLRLRQVCCHCGLIAPMLKKDDTEGLAEDEVKDLPAEMNRLTLEDSNESRNKAKEGMTAAEAMRTVLSPDEPVFQLTRRSSKIQEVMDCLTKNVLSTKDEKAVVVSQWTSVLSLVEQELKQERVKTVTLSGKVPVPARAAVVNKLNDPNSDTRVMLLSLCAGGVGLNLCGASHLLLIDPHWNPQLEEQAQDRVYRVGQTRPVHIYRFMCVETVEQNIRRLQDMKLAMADNVLSGARQVTGSKLTIEDLKLLFNMGPQEHGVLHANQFFMIHAQQRGRSAL